MLTPEGAIARFPEMLDFVPGARIASADDPLPPALSEDDLVAAVARAGGHVIIGLKSPGDHRTAETGETPGISRGNALAARASLRAAGVEITRTYRHSSAVAATVDPERVRVLRHLPGVDYIEPVSSGTLQSQDTTWGLRKMYVPQIWTGGFWGPSVRGQGAFVTILDAGMDEIHRWSGDGPASLYSDCYHVEGMPPGHRDCYNHSSGGGLDGHGVHVAGIINGADNGSGWIGMAPDLARFASIKVCAPGVGCPDDMVASGLDWVLGQTTPRRIVNISLGFCQDFYYIREWVRKLDSAGVVIVASAGNYRPGQSFPDACPDGQVDNLPNWRTSVMYPARYSPVIAVSGTTPDDAFAVPPAPGAPTHGGGGAVDCGGLECAATANACGAGSRWGGGVDIAAPFWDTSMVRAGAYNVQCGTSMSAAFVSGAAALVWSRFPTYTAAQVRERLLSTTVPLSPDSQFGSGRLNAFNAVYGSALPPSFMVSVTGPDEVRPYAACVFQAIPNNGIEPFSYTWTADGTPVGSDSPFYRHPAGTNGFELGITVTDGQGRVGNNIFSVSVSYSAPECLDQ
jgi:subtilisin